MSDKTNRPQNDPHPARQQGSGEKESTNRHVYIEPGVQIDLVKDLKDTYKASRGESTTHNKKQLFWTQVSAGLLFIYAALAWWQGWSAHKTLQAVGEQFRLDQRPYLSVTKLEIMDD